MTNKKLGLLLLPLLPLSALGIVEVAGRIMPAPPAVTEPCEASVIESATLPRTPPRVSPPRVFAPPAPVAPFEMPTASVRG